jgi:L-threonylcarbamoyladenylate synthase
MPDLEASLRPASAQLRAAAEALRAGRLVIMPTETVYGLAADVGNDTAVAAVFSAKGRPEFNPLIVHVADLSAAQTIADFHPAALALAQAFWPGPLTLVLPRRAQAHVSLLATAGLDTVAVRVPAHPVAQALLGAFGGPLAAPSANRSGRVSPTTAADAGADFPDGVAMVLDGGPCTVGVESTIIGFTDDGRLVLLRPGGLPREDIVRVAGPLADHVRRGAPSAPGQLASHYAPRAAMRLNALSPEPGEAYLAFGPSMPASDGMILNLSPAGDLIEAAANLFSFLRRLDASGAEVIAVSPIPSQGLGEAINDRLARAAAPREETQ